MIEIGNGVKPKIKRNQGRWICICSLAMGEGDIPIVAYLDWQLKLSRILAVQ